MFLRHDGFRRLCRARELLAQLDGPQPSVTAVCMQVGFSSLGSFSTLFSRRFGETPSAYRRPVQPANLCPDASV
jgi:AraC-like DNA-binding protein